MPEKIYIESFADDLNYQPIILFIDPSVNMDDVLKELEQDNINHLYNFDDEVRRTGLFYIENMDLQTVEINAYRNKLLYKLIEENYSLYSLGKDEIGFYMVNIDVDGGQFNELWNFIFSYMASSKRLLIKRRENENQN